MRVLVVEDEPRMADMLRRGLARAGMTVDVTGAGADALWMAASTPYDAIVLDVGLPDVDGFEVCRRLRADDVWAPVLMLTARDAVEDRIDGLDAGADDYLVKPFDVGELKARLRALLRRSVVEDEGPEALSFEELRLEPERHGVKVGAEYVELTRTEYQLLELLMRNPRRVLPHDLIYDRVWGYDFGPASNALRVYVGYLRRKLQDAGARPLLHTVRGVGYVLREPER
jgi:DNA-binding response OmpR family regulator